MKNLKDYKKPNKEKLDLIIKSVAIEKRHEVYIKNNNIELSRLVRDLLDKTFRLKKG
jgi:hypothetical protein